MTTKLKSYRLTCLCRRGTDCMGQRLSRRCKAVKGEEVGDNANALMKEEYGKRYELVRIISITQA